MSAIAEGEIPQGGSELTKGTGRSAGKIGISVAVSIALGYVFTVAAAHLLSAEDYAIFLTFWALIMGLGSALSPVGEETSRLSTLASLRGGRAGKPALRAIAICVVIAALFSCIIMIPPVNSRLFHGQSHFDLAIILLIGGVAFACQFGARGLLIGQNHIKQFAWLNVAEPAARALALGLLVISSAYGLTSLAIATAVGSFAWLLFAGLAAKLVDPHFVGEKSDSWRPMTSRVVMLVVGAGLTASIITGYPAMVNLISPGGDQAKLAALFSALMVARTPLILLQPLQMVAVPTVVRLSHSEQGRHKLWKLMAVGSVASLIAAAIGAALGWLIGPWVVQLIFGSKYQVEGWAVAGLVWSSVLLIPMQMLTAVLIARTQANRVLITWAVVVAATAAVLLFAPGDVVFRASVGLAVGPTLGLAVVMAFVLNKAAGGTGQATAQNAEVPTNL